MSHRTFRYRAIDSSGRSRRGEHVAPSEQSAYRELLAMGLTPTEIRERGGDSVGGAGRGRVTASDIAQFTRELSVLVEANMPLARGLASIGEGDCKPGVRWLVRDLATRIEAGAAISEAITAHQALLGEGYVSAMAAAEKSGNLAGILAHLADMLEKQHEISQQVRRALTYPIVVLAAVTLAVSVVVVFVVPRFARIFTGNGVEMPLATRIVMGVGVTVKEWWWACLLALAIAGPASVVLARSRGGRRAIERALFHLPGVRGLVRATTAARFARVLGVSLGSGLEVIDAMRLSARATGRILLAEEAEAMAASLQRGESFGEVMEASRLLPSFARRMIAAGKDSREIGKACDVVARHYERESSNASKTVATLMEPIMTVLLAGVVLLVALSVFLPMWQMISLQGGGTR